MKWILFPIVMATTADKMGFIGAGEGVHVAATIEFFTIGVSVRLSDRSLHREEQKKKFRQKLHPVGFETRTSGSSGQCLTNCAK